MSGEINVGMKFGTYDGMLETFKQSCDVKQQTNRAQENNESKYTFFKKGTNNVMGNCYRENIELSEYSQPKYADAVLFTNNYQYGTSAKDKKSLNIFDYVVGKDKFALDLNGNGEVDENEIFSGKFDSYAYKKAKDSGDLNNYSKYIEVYSYKWLKY